MRTLLIALVSSLTGSFTAKYAKQKEANVYLDNVTGDAVIVDEFNSGQMPVVNNRRHPVYAVFIKFLSPAANVEADADVNDIIYANMMVAAREYSNLLDDAASIGIISIDGWNKIAENANDCLYIGIELVITCYDATLAQC